MAVYTYNSEVYPKISEYSDTPISVLGSYVVSEFVSSSSIYIISDDYGLITETTGILSSDYGSISTEEDVIEDYYTITITQTNPVFGFIKNIVSLYELSVTNSSVGGIQFVLQGGSYSSFGSAYIGYDLATITGAATNIRNTESYVGSGLLFGFGSKAERITFSYNESSTVGDIFVDDFGNIADTNQSTEDYGTVTESPTSYENYYYLLNITIDDCGLISSATEDIDSYGLVSENPVFYADYGNLELPPSYDTVKKPFGFTRFSGSAINYNNTESYVGHNYSSITGSALVAIKPLHFGSGSILISGSLVEKNTESYFGTGSLFAYTGSAESTTSIPPVSGLFRFSSAVIEKNTESYVGSGSLFSLNSSTKSSGANPPESTILFRFSGAASDLKNTESYVGTGSLFGFGSKAEKVSFSYNESSVVGDVIVNDFGYIIDSIQSIEDYGSITESPTSYEEYYYLLDISIDDSGSITNPAIEIDTYGFIGETPSSYDDYGTLELVPTYSTSRRPFGFGRFSSAVVEKNTESYVGHNYVSINGNANVTVKPQHIGSGSLSISGAATNIKNTESYVGTGSLFAYTGSAESTTSIPPVSGLFRFSSAVIEKNTESYVGYNYAEINGTANVSVKPQHVGSGSLSISGAASDLKNTESYVGTGSLFGFGSKAEKVSFSYNESSVVGDVIVNDFGLIVDQNDSTEDYGSITESPTSYEEYYYLLDISIDDYGLITNLPIYIDGYGSIAESTVSYDDYGTLELVPTYSTSRRPFGFGRFSSAVVEKNTESYVGSGSLFSYIGSVEATTSNPPENIQLFRFSGSLVEKNTESYVGTGSLFAYTGSAESTTSIPPVSGLFRFSSAVIEKNTESYVGSGSLFAYIGAAESTTLNPPENIQLFRFSGALAESYVPATEIGSGRLFGVGSKLERTTYSYNESSVVGEASLNDYGFISYTIDESEDYGTITELPTFNAYDDFGSITVPVKKPYGFSKFSGSATNLKVRLCYFGSGSLFSYTGSAEAFGANPPESTELFKFSGSAIQKNTESYVGKGSLFTYVSFTESTLVRPSATGLFKFSGSLVEKNTESYFGTGLLLIKGNVDSSVKPQYDGFGKITIFDSAAESFSEGLYTGTGSLFTTGGHAVTFIANPPENIQLFRFSGSLVEKNTESYVGSGSLFSYTGSAEAFGTNPPENIQLFRFSGASTESYTPATEIGSGSFTLNRPFAILDPEDKIRLSNIKESFSFRPKPSTIEMSLTGELGIYFVNIYQGLARFRVDGAALVKTNPVHVGSGKIQTGANCFQSFAPAPHKGSGTLFTYIGSAETFVANPPENTQLFKFSGSSKESYTPATEVGSGIAKVNIESLILINFDYPGKERIEINGNSIELKSQAYSGKGKAELSGDAGVYFSNKFVSSGDPIRLYVNGKESTSNPHIGSGSLFGFVSKTEIFGANPPERTELFKISGSARDNFIQSHTGSGRFQFNSTTSLLDISDKQKLVGSYESTSSTPALKSRSLNIKGTLESEKTTEIFVGSGSLFGFGSSVEVFGTNPPENTALFKISGKSQEGATKRKIGSGSLFSYVGSAESFSANPPENAQLFNISGFSSESYTPATEIGRGKLFGFGGASETTSVSEVSRVIFEFNGSSNERINKSYLGEGSLFGLGGSARSAVYTFKVSERAFRIFGRSFGSFAYGAYYGECSSNFVGKSSDQKVNYEAPKPIILYVI